MHWALEPGLKDNNPAREKFTPYRLLETSTPVGNLAESLADIKGLRTQVRTLGLSSYIFRNCGGDRM